ncbi:MAG: twin-arginine translocation signal domain-containing protein, partial [Bacteroidetes bacterium]|nr:twin-arginine translocation signal domain-containing protein [Bacteroidota bacterium]
MNSRRDFIKMSALAGTGMLLPGARMPTLAATANPYAGNLLLDASYSLLQKWGAGLLSLQLSFPDVKTLHGGILCPACSMIHGRSGDAMFPLLLLAGKTKDQRYLDAALNVYEWMENNVSQPNGSWVNEIVASSWAGITVFTIIAMGESIVHFGHLPAPAVKQRWLARMDRAAKYICDTFTIKTGNINYPIAASYALSLAGEILGKPAYSARGKLLAHEALGHFTAKDLLLYGEGHPAKEPSPKGCYSVDLGYNVEESLPSLVLYGKLTGDSEVLDLVTQSLKAHLEFMLPDGGWDNSWGTRNFKWTWWGSRTSDGCQPAYALMADRDPVFYKAALQNTRLFD